MAPGPRAPRANAITRANEVLARKHSVVSICPALDQVSIHFGPPVATAVVGAKGVAEGAGWRREEWRGKWTRGALGKERDARVELEGKAW